MGQHSQANMISRIGTELMLQGGKGQRRRQGPFAGDESGAKLPQNQRHRNHLHIPSAVRLGVAGSLG
jgi:hypothetical protein